MTDRTRCEFCGKTRGVFNRVAYAGAPDGGVPVHVGCTADFFKRIDGTLEEPVDNRTNQPCAECGSSADMVQRVIVGEPGHLRTHEAWLHPDCERTYLAKLARA